MKIDSKRNTFFQVFMVCILNDLPKFAFVYVYIVDLGYLLFDKMQYIRYDLNCTIIKPLRIKIRLMLKDYIISNSTKNMSLWNMWFVAYFVISSKHW